MASHGIPRASAPLDRGTEARQKELIEIGAYQSLVEEVNAQVEKKEYTPALLQKTAELLKKNPEYYTIWNHRRRIYINEFNDLEGLISRGELSKDDRVKQILDIIQLDLQFLFPLLLKFPKCYWIWNHRLWLLEQSSLLLPVDEARTLWNEELGLVGKMLARDNRNFHGWGYRRMVVKNLESFGNESLAKQELDYTTKMISANLSNFSAWHNRSKLIIRTLDEQGASDGERKQMLDEELRLIHNALIDPFDQSIWFYHQNLRCAFDPDMSTKTMAPNLSTEDRRSYVEAEREFVKELLEDTEDCKWIYQALIELALLDDKLKGSITVASMEEVNERLEKLKKLDPLRRGRWQDLERTLESLSVS